MFYNEKREYIHFWKMALNPSIQFVCLHGLLRRGVSTGLFLKLCSITYFNIVVVRSTCSVLQGDSVSWMVHVVVDVSAFGQTLGTSVGTRLGCFSGLGRLCNRAVDLPLKKFSWVASYCLCGSGMERCYRVNVSVPPEFKGWVPSPKVMLFRRWGLWGVSWS